MLTVWSRSFMTATRHEPHDGMTWSAPDHWRTPHHRGLRRHRSDPLPLDTQPKETRHD